jgi:hypothetical protein
MPIKKHKPEQIVALLRQVEVEIREWQDHVTNLQGSRDHGLSLCFGLRHHLPRSFRGVR